MNAPPESIPKLYFVLKTIEIIPDNIIIIKKGSVTFRSIVKWLRRNNPDFYYTLLSVFDCDSDTCLSRSMSNIFLAWIGQHISFSGQTQKVGDIRDVAREWLSKIYERYTIFR